MENELINYSVFPDTKNVTTEIIQTNTPVGDNMSGIQIFNFSIDSSEVLLPSKTRLRMKVKGCKHTGNGTNEPLPCMSAEALLSCFSDYREYLAGTEITYIQEPAQAKYLSDVLFASAQEASQPLVSLACPVANVDGDITQAYEALENVRLTHNNQDLKNCANGYFEARVPSFFFGNCMTTSDTIVGGFTNCRIELQTANSFRGKLLNNSMVDTIPIQGFKGFLDTSVTPTYLFDVISLELVICKLKKASVNVPLMRIYHTPQVYFQQFPITSKQQTNSVNIMRGCKRVAIFFQSTNIGDVQLGVNGPLKGSNSVTDLSTGICCDSLGTTPSDKGINLILRNLVRCTLRYDGNQYPAVEYQMTKGSTDLTPATFLTTNSTLEDNRRAYNEYLDQISLPTLAGSVDVVMRDRASPQLSFEQWDNAKMFCWNLVTSSGLASQNATVSLQFTDCPTPYKSAICMVAQYFDKQLDIEMDSNYRSSIKKFEAVV
jgi:hypothetical protein